MHQITTQGGGMADDFDPETFVTQFAFSTSNNGNNWTKIAVAIASYSLSVIKHY